jgi:hypothetical protein
VPYVIFTSPLPEVPLSPVQSLDPLAEHEEAFDDEKVKVTDVPVAADEDDALKFIVGAGIEGASGPPPPPPPPPQLEMINNDDKTIRLIFFINLDHDLYVQIIYIIKYRNENWP